MNLRRNEHGQSTVEFALTLTLLLAFVLFFVQLCLVFGLGNYIHYATFMSARAYLAAGNTVDSQQERARRVVIRMLKKSEGSADTDRFPFIAKGVEGNDLKGLEFHSGVDDTGAESSKNWMVGVRYIFRSKLFLLPLTRASSGGNGKKSINQVTLTSESWLMREPNYDECASRMGEKNWIFDNGC